MAVRCQRLMFRLSSSNRKHNRTHFFKYVSVDVAKIILKSRLLRYNSPLIFNDLLDIPRELNFPFTNQELENGISDELINMIENSDISNIRGSRNVRLIQMLAKLGGKEARKRIVADIRNFNSEYAGGILELFQEIWKSQISTLRILCLSEVNYNMVMWNLYAGQYYGVVFRLECIDEVDSSLLLARQISYTKEPLDLMALKTWIQIILENDQESLNKLVEASRYFKTPEWKHEKEWRVVTFARDGEPEKHTDFGFRAQEISEIYLGPKISRDDEIEILRLLKGDLGHVNAYRAKIDEFNRRIIFEPINLTKQ